MAQFDVIIIQEIGGGVFKEMRLTPAVGDVLFFDAGKILVVGAPASVAPLAHQTTHAPNGTDPLPWTTVHGLGTLAARPAAGAVNNGYVYFATDDDGGTIARSNGATWVDLTRGLTQAPPVHAVGHLAGGVDPMAWTLVLGRDLVAARPAAGATNAGYLFFATDVAGGTWYQSDGAVWQPNSIGLTEVATVPRGGTGAATLTGVVIGNGAGAMTAVQVNLNSAVAPTVTDDSAAGYAVFSVWINTTLDIIWDCVDASVGAAIWRQRGGTPAVILTSPTTGLTVDFNDNSLDQVMYATPAADIAALTIDLPSNATSIVGQVVEFFSSQVITTITWTGATTILGEPSTFATDEMGVRLRKVASNTWICFQ